MAVGSSNVIRGGVGGGGSLYTVLMVLGLSLFASLSDLDAQTSAGLPVDKPETMGLSVYGGLEGDYSTTGIEIRGAMAERAAVVLSINAFNPAVGQGGEQPPIHVDNLSFRVLQGIGREERLKLLFGFAWENGPKLQNYLAGVFAGARLDIDLSDGPLGDDSEVRLLAFGELANHGSNPISFAEEAIVVGGLVDLLKDFSDDFSAFARVRAKFQVAQGDILPFSEWQDLSGDVGVSYEFIPNGRLFLLAGLRGRANDEFRDLSAFRSLDGSGSVDGARDTDLGLAPFARLGAEYGF